MTERDRWDLRGPVRACETRRTWYTRRCGGDTCEIKERGDLAVLELRADGAMARRSHRNFDGSEWTTAYDYDEAGRLATARTGNADDFALLQLFEYDAEGRLSRVMERLGGRDDHRKLRVSCVRRQGEDVL